jgi:glycosyltransferase involved in cell wall biosynthesis
MKVVIVNKHREDTLGGSELQCDLIATELSNRGYDVTYIAIMGEEKKYSSDYRVIPCKKDAEELLNKIRSCNPDVVYWRYHKNFINDIFKPLHDANVKIVFAVSSEYDVHRFLYNRKQTIRYNLRRLFRNIKQFRGFKYVNAVVVNNESHLDKLPVKKQKFIPNGMADDYVPFEWEKPYCIWVANIKSIKRPEIYIEMAKQIGLVDFLMVGDIQQEKYRWMENKQELPENLHYLGPKTVTEVNGMIRESLFHIHTCMAEGFPNVFIQAWFFGKPSVSYGFDPSNYINKNSLGFCSEENMAKFVEDVKQLCNDSKKRNEMGKNASSFAKKMFKIENSVSMLEDLVKEL